MRQRTVGTKRKRESSSPPKTRALFRAPQHFSIREIEASAQLTQNVTLLELIRKNIIRDPMDLLSEVALCTSPSSSPRRGNNREAARTLTHRFKATRLPSPGAEYRVAQSQPSRLVNPGGDLQCSTKPVSHAERTPPAEGKNEPPTQVARGLKVRGLKLY